MKSLLPFFTSRRPWLRSFRERAEDARWWLAGWLAWAACRLMGHRWYVADVWHGIPGNRAAELEQMVWEKAVLLQAIHGEQMKQDTLQELEPALRELAQAARAVSGHVWPKEAAHV
jgi:hypothetical protein